MDAWYGEWSNITYYCVWVKIFYLVQDHVVGVKEHYTFVVRGGVLPSVPM